MKNNFVIRSRAIKARVFEALSGRPATTTNIDLRTKEGKAFKQAYNNCPRISNEEAKRMRIKHLDRRARKWSAPTFDQRNKLAFDYLRNRNNIRYINANHLRFNDGRGHYAKNSHDLKLIELIQRWHAAYKIKMAPIWEAARIENETRAKRQIESMKLELLKPVRGWYVVTLEAIVSRIHGNDGKKCYSFRVLANNAMEAFDRAAHLCQFENQDRHISFVYEVCDSAYTALIEYVGVWTDESVIEYGTECTAN